MKLIIKIVFILSILLFTYCRYEEGPFFSLQTPEKRLLGLWEISSLKKNGIDYISTYKNDSVYMKISIVRYDELFINLVKEGRSGSQLASSNLYLENNKTILRFSLRKQVIYDSLLNPFVNLLPHFFSENEWLILKLKSSEFAIKKNQDSNSPEYYIEFVRLEKY